MEAQKVPMDDRSSSLELKHRAYVGNVPRGYASFVKL